MIILTKDMNKPDIQNAKHIEFVGLPGSGKTHLLKRLSRKNKKTKLTPSKIKCGETKYLIKLKKRNIRWTYYFIPKILQRKLAKKYYNIRFNREETEALIQFVEKYKPFLQLISDILYKKDVRDVFLSIRKFETIIIDYILSQSYMDDNEIILFDEGFVQKIVGLHLTAGITYCNLKEYINKSPMPKLIIHVDAPVELAHQRLNKRGWPAWLPTKNNLSKWQLLSQTKEKIDSICDLYSNNNVPIITIQNEHISKEYISKKFYEIEHLTFDSTRKHTRQ